MKTIIGLIFLASILLSQEKMELDSTIYSDTPIKDPTKSILLSLAIPGGGQFYNESYVRSALYFSTVSYFVVTAIINQRRLNDIFKNRTSFISSVERSNQIDVYYNKRNVAIWRAFGLYLLNVLDAWAGSYLFGFDEIMDGENQNAFSTFQIEDNNLIFKLTINF